MIRDTFTVLHNRTGKVQIHSTNSQPTISPPSEAEYYVTQQERQIETAFLQGQQQDGGRSLLLDRRRVGREAIHYRASELSSYSTSRPASYYPIQAVGRTRCIKSNAPTRGKQR